MAIRSIFQLFGIFYCHLLYFVIMWYIFPRFVKLYKGKIWQSSSKEAHTTKLLETVCLSVELFYEFWMILLKYYTFSLKNFHTMPWRLTWSTSPLSIDEIVRSNPASVPIRWKLLKRKKIIRFQDK
jgi:hypothetical protein